MVDEGALGFLVTAAPFVLCLGGVFLAIVGVVAWLLLKGKGQYRQLVKHLQQAKAIPIGQLSAAEGLVRIQGVIRQVSNSFGVLNTAQLAMLRLQISGMKEGDHGAERGPIEGKEKAVPFLIQDGSGAVWVDPHPLDHRVMGKSRPANPAEVDEACALLNMDLNGLRRWSAPDTFEVWAWEVGQQVTVVGQVQRLQDGRTTIGRIDSHPMIVSPIAGEVLADTIAKDAGRSGKVSTIIVIVLAALVLFVFCCIAMTIFQMLKSGG